MTEQERTRARVLAGDDEKSIRSTLCAFLNDAGRQADEAEDAKAAERTQALPDSNRRLEATLVEVERSREEIASQEQDPPAGGGGRAVLKVLVVDDEERARGLIKRFLSLYGHTVLSVASGREALETFRRERVDLVITDRAIPDMGGDEIAAEIKRLAPLTPVIMLTGFGDMMEVRREKPAGVDYVLGKPVAPDQLQEAVMRTARGQT